MSSKELLDACRRLPVDERVQLAEQLWESIEGDAEHDGAELTAAERAELDQALAEYRANPSAGTDWEAAKARILAGL